MIRRLVDRWMVGQQPAFGARSESSIAPWLLSSLRNLERVLGVLHPAIEYPTVSTQSAECSTTTSITATSSTDITGATITFTPDVDSVLAITAVFAVESSALGAVGQGFVGEIIVNGTPLAGQALWKPAAASTSVTLSTTLPVTVDSGTEYIVKLAAKTTNVAATFSVLRFATVLNLLLVPNPYKVP